MKKLIDFSDVVLKKVEIIREREGHKTFTAALFSTISQYYDKKYFSKYQGLVKNIGVPKEEITDEQYCESVGGKVAKDSGGGKTCLIQKGGGMISVPLSDRKSILIRAKQVGLV